MNAVVLHGFGGPEVLEGASLPVPEPGPGEILVAVESVGVGRFLDLTARAGRHPYPGFTFPHVLGADCAGTVAAHGPGVDGPALGVRVAAFPGCACNRCRYCEDGRDQACSALQVLGIHRQGGYADFVTVPASVLYEIPDEVGCDDAAATVLTGSVAWNQLDSADFTAGQWVLVQSASSALGSSTAELARHLGGRVIATSRDPLKRKRLAELGFEAVLDSASPDLVRQVRECSGGGVDVAIDNIGAPDLWPSTLSAVADHGVVVSSGAFAGGVVPLNLAELYSRNLRVIGIRTGSRRSTAAAWALLRDGFRPVVDRTFPLHDARLAHEYLEAGGGVGRVLLHPH